MGLGIGLIVTVVGFVLALAVHPSNPQPVDVNAVGWILVVVGLIVLLADIVFWSSRGPGYARRRTYVTDAPGYGGYGYRGWPRRRVIEEEDVPPPGPGL